MNSEIGERIRAMLRSPETSSSERELATLADMAPDALSRAMSGSRGFAVSELVRLAGALGTSTHWLATGDDDPYAIEVAARHGFDTETMTHAAVEWAPARLRLEDIALAYEQVGARESPPAEAATPLPGLEADAARSALKTVAGPDFVRHLAEAVEKTFGLDVVRVDGLQGGYSMRVAHRAIVVLGDTSNWFYQNWSLAHELGHVAQGTMEPLDDPDRDASARERRANAYAAELLLPRDQMRAVDWATMGPDELARFLWNTGVSTRTTANRLKSLRIPIPSALQRPLSQSTQLVLRSHSGSLPADAASLITERMRQASARRFPVSLLSAHREAVASGRLHAHTLAWMLGDDAGALENELAPGRADHGTRI